MTHPSAPPLGTVPALPSEQPPIVNAAPPVEPPVVIKDTVGDTPFKDAELIPANWLILPAADGNISATCNHGGRVFVGTTKAFSAKIRGQ